MAAVIDPKSKKYIGNKLFVKTFVAVSGTGALASGDDIVTNVRDYPIGSEYYDAPNNAFYKRIAGVGVVADWVKLTASA